MAALSGSCPLHTASKTDGYDCSIVVTLFYSKSTGRAGAYRLSCRHAVFRQAPVVIMTILSTGYSPGVRICFAKSYPGIVGAGRQGPQRFFLQIPLPVPEKAALPGVSLGTVRCYGYLYT
jgi:hypothetical protein